MADLPERRYLNDRRRPDRADDLHRRLEEKRQQIERRQTVRRQSDRDSSVHDDRSEAADSRSSQPSHREDRPASE